MSGHNKFSQIKHQKGAEDAKRSKLFGILGKMISVQSRAAKGDTNNPALRAAIEKARKQNMPKENIERAVKRGAGGEENALEEVLYEAYGPGGAAMRIEGVTESRNRTSNEIKNILSEHGASLAAPGSTDWAKGTTVPLSNDDKQKLLALVAELDSHDDVSSVWHNAQ